MHYFLIRLSYTSQAWAGQLADRVGAQQRLSAVKSLATNLGGSFAHFHFFADSRDAGARQHTIRDKFMGLGGGDDVVTVVAFPDLQHAHAFSKAIAAEPGVKSIDLSPILPMEQAIEAMGRAHDAKTKANYSAPGGQSRSWLGH